MRTTRADQQSTPPVITNPSGKPDRRVVALPDRRLQHLQQSQGPGEGGRPRLLLPAPEGDRRRVGQPGLRAWPVHSTSRALRAASRAQAPTRVAARVFTRSFCITTRTAPTHDRCTIRAAAYSDLRPSRSRGMAAVEFVIMLPLLLLLMLVGVGARARVRRIFDISRYSVRNSARFVSVNAIAGDDRRDQSTPRTLSGDARNLAVYGKIVAGGDPRLHNFQPGHLAVEDAGNNNIRVIANYPVRATWPNSASAIVLIPPPLTLHIAVTMRAIS